MSTPSQKIVSAAADVNEAAAVWARASFAHGLDCDINKNTLAEQAAVRDAVDALLKAAGVDPFDLVLENMRRREAEMRKDADA